MKAILIKQPGGPEVMHYGDTPDPQPASGEIVVRVRGCAVNRADVMQRMGAYPPPPGASPILGLEIAGTVERAAGNWQVGDRVMAVVTGGAYAELATVPADLAMPIPEGMSFDEAAAIPEAFLTAYLNLFMLGNLQQGETVLIHAGASGVGTAAIQLAQAARAIVIATAGSPEKLRRCVELGAQETINYKEADFAQRVLEVTQNRGADVVLDFVGASNWERNLEAMAQYGRLMLIGFLGNSSGALDLGPIMRKSLTITGTTLRRTPIPRKIALVKAFDQFAMPRFASGELKPVIHSVFPLSQAKDAHILMESNQNIGKLVLRV